uniref:Amino acid transporter transmembrane domain-containing protein n=1 Tax=Zooxanthella nutricula TaxID=1333877 RepID=A0A7S2LE85_9DINO|eukprot:CAMPEP_0198500694 /NCGR_PEP_ID=MMETSP1462-20131121/8294_1 /TAXON_ID=1333877 /ORGANISM="Brandtodinium nutriculum, Strain RCC3387" /LENGTH=412 /DNA_ID=CAMNT_0044229709 /DNA_START=125 /DNA_END=1363 /DNA_ORIENTATION=+
MTAAPPRLGEGRLKTWATLSSMLIGPGVLTVGTAFNASGLVIAPIVVLAMAVLCCWTMVLIAKCLDRAAILVPEKDRNGEAVDWPLVGQAVAGTLGRRAVEVMFFLELLFASVSTQVISGTALRVVFPGVDTALLLVIAGGATLLLLAVPETFFWWVSSAGLLAAATFAASLVASGALLEGDIPAAGVTLADFGGAPATLAIAATLMMAHSEIGGVYERMDRKEHFPRVCIGAFAVVTAFYLAVGAAGYLFYGNRVRIDLLENVGFDAEGRPLPGMAWLQKLAAAMFTVKLQAVMPLLIEPLARMFETSPVCGGAAKAGNGNWMRRGGLRVACTLIPLAIAVFLRDKAEAVAELTGSLTCLSMSVLFPVLCYWKLHRPALSMLAQTCLGVVTIVCLAAQIAGTRAAMNGFFA